ncbi:MAG: 50S ribosomal protein L23 [Patescibacteria group bacterium]
MKTFDILIKPVITEKATSNEKEGKYQFFVRKDATKVDIRKAFQQVYGTPVVKVNIMVTAEKKRLGKNRREMTKKHSLKKVIITTKGRKAVDVMKPKMKA